MFNISASFVVVTSLLFLASLLIYYGAHPKPIPGIPYDKVSAAKMFGDLPGAIEYQNKTGMMMEYCRNKCFELNSPVFQVFIRPFVQPWVIICDGREAQDIMTLRTKDFDRSTMFGDLFRAYLPYSQAPMLTNHQWRFNRRLVSDTMSPRFLENTAAPRVYESTNDLVALWKEKSRLAKGHTIDVQADISMAVVDIIWAATFGSDLETCQSQSRYLAAIPEIALPQDNKTCTEIPSCAPPKAYTALTTLFSSSDIALRSPFGFYAHWFALRTYPSLRNAMKVRNKMVHERVQSSYEKFAENSSKKSGVIKAAVDIVVEREIGAARKEGRKPMQSSVIKYIHDELSLFLSAGSSTTAEAVCWGMKYLTAYQDVQEKLRAGIKAAYSGAVESGLQPAAEVIAKTHIPYLEAFMSETLRHGANIMAHVRTAKIDTEVLGYHVPKGTEVVMMINGPSFHYPAMSIDDGKRSQTSQASKPESIKKWNLNDPEVFNPERWLIQNERGETGFDPHAAPMQTFGEGPRACFGKRLAMLEMRLMYTLILWNFELMPIDPSLMDFGKVQVLTVNPRNVRVALKDISS